MNDLQKSIFEKIKGKEAYSCFGLAASLVPLAYVVYQDHFAYTAVLVVIVILGLAGLFGRLYDKRRTSNCSPLLADEEEDYGGSGEIVNSDSPKNGFLS